MLIPAQALTHSVTCALCSPPVGFPRYRGTLLYLPVTSYELQLEVICKLAKVVGLTLLQTM